MRRIRVAVAAVFSAVALALVADPVAAQASATSELINQLNARLLYVAVPITLLVEAVLIYAVWKFRKSDEAKPTLENRRLEITWTVATAIVLLFVGVASYGVLANPNVTFTAQEGPGDQIPQGDDVVVVHAEAYQWGWNMSYPRHGFSTGSNVVIPTDRPVYFQITSRDVIHAFHVPELALKQDAMPGKTYVVRTEVYETGEYQGYCAEFCGVSHSQMYFTVNATTPQQYEQWLQSQTSGGQGSGSGGSGGQSSGASGSGSASGDLVARA